MQEERKFKVILGYIECLDLSELHETLSYKKKKKDGREEEREEREKKGLGEVRREKKSGGKRKMCLYLTSEQ